MLTQLILACSVAADATAVSIAASIRGITFRRAFVLAFAFGAAQAIMAAIGWLGGASLGDVWKAWDHWIALALLSFVGLNMIREAFAHEEEREPIVAGPASVLTLSIATSLDALAVGVTLPTLGAAESVALALIGGITFLFSAAGALLGRYLGARFGRAMEIAGGVALIAIGIRIVIEHTR